MKIGKNIKSHTHEKHMEDTTAPSTPRRIALLSALILLAACSGAPSRPQAEPPATSATSPGHAPRTAQDASSPSAGNGTPAAGTEAPGNAEAPDSPRGPDEENAIFFATASSRIDAEGERKLERHAARLRADPRLTVTLIGHTDNLGSSSYNLAIAEQRTAAVARALIGQGVRRAQIRRYGVGDEKAADHCRPATCRQQMRRVDLIYAE